MSTDTNPIASAASTLWASIVRTIVPAVVGAVAAFFIARGFALDPGVLPSLELLLTLLLTALYYVIVRLLETYVTPKLGWLLGLAKSPDAYTKLSPARHAKDGTYDVSSLPPIPLADGKDSTPPVL